MIRRIGCLALSLALGVAHPPRAATYLVQPDGSGDHPTIQAAVDAASDGDEILLGDGTFTGSGNHGIDYLGKAITIRSASGLAETAIVDCESGDPFGPDFSGFLFRTGEGSGSRLEAITIVHSYLAIRCDGGSPVLEELTIRDGWTPVIGCTGSAPVLRGCVIESNVLVNTRSGYGGTVALYATDATIESCTIRDNSWNGIRVASSSPTVRDCRIEGNGGYRGGGIEIYGDSSPWIEACTIVGNRAGFGGGGLYLSTPPGTEVTVKDCTITGNRAVGGAGWGGGIFAGGDVPVTIEDCTIAGNTAAGGGGGVYVPTSRALVFRGCTITGNEATVWGGGIFLNGQSAVSFDRCTITRNDARHGGGAVVTGHATADLQRSIVWGNCAVTSGPEMWLGEGATIDLSCIDIAQAGIFFYGTATVTYGGDVLDTDPLFCEPLECGLATGGVYTVAVGSPVLTQACGAMGAHDAGCDATTAGASLEAASWGAIKARYR